MLLTLKGLSRLERCTRYWPMVISETLLCNMMQVTSRKKKVWILCKEIYVINLTWIFCNFFFLKQLLEPLPLLIMKETITENDVLECKRVSLLYKKIMLLVKYPSKYRNYNKLLNHNFNNYSQQLFIQVYLHMCFIDLGDLQSPGDGE